MAEKSLSNASINEPKNLIANSGCKILIILNVDISLDKQFIKRYPSWHTKLKKLRDRK